MQTQKSIAHQLGFALAAFIIALLIPTFIIAQHNLPIPHALERRDDCLACHQTGFAGTPKIPTNHADWTNDTCRDCHQPGDGAEPIPPSMEQLVDCLKCHQTGDNNSPKYPDDHIGRTNSDCLVCHQVTIRGTPKAATPTPTPGIPDVSHPLEGRDDCLLCHEAGEGAPNNHAGGANDICLGCHQLSSPAEEATPSPPPEIPHTLEGGWADCLACHKAGIGGGAQVPADHVNWTSGACRGCHQPGTSETVPTPVPEIPHALQDGDDCRNCHQTGTNGAPQFPDDHIDWPNEVCQICHLMAPVAPDMSHPVEGWNDCRSCHETGVGESPQFPDDHTDRANDICLDCHQTSPTETAPPAAPDIPHLLEGRDECLACHGSGLTGFPQVPAHHVDWGDDKCRECHRVSAEIAHGDQVPAYLLIPHALERREDCRACHATGVEAPQFPDDHTDWPNEICMGCHLLQAPPPMPRQHCFECHVIGSRASTEDTETTDVDVSSIPHTLDNRDDCLSCHQEGVGVAVPMPDNHAGQPNEMCQGCHKPGSPRPKPAPTPTLYPWPEGLSSCRDCHLTLQDKRLNVVAQWEHSIHAEHKVNCADCHSGDPEAGTKAEAKAPATGYIGIPAKADIAPLCIGCHPNLAWMSQDDLPAGQWAEYEDSVHSLHLSKGVREMVTCFDCHGGHQILKADNPASPIYPTNVPGVCVNCHADDVTGTAGEALTNNTFRRWAMAAIVAIGGLTVMVLYMRRRETGEVPKVK